MDPHIHEDVVAFVHDALRFPIRRALTRQLRCSACGTSLAMPARRTERSVTITLPGRPVFTITVPLVASRCPGCGLDNVLEHRRGDVGQAVIDALQAGAIDPPGALD